MTVEHNEPGNLILMSSGDVQRGGHIIGTIQDKMQEGQTVSEVGIKFQADGGLADDFLSAGIIKFETQNGRDVALLVNKEDLPDESE